MSALPLPTLPTHAIDAADPDPQETAEWLDALQGVLHHAGPGRAHVLLDRLIEFARTQGEHLPFAATTPYINTIRAEAQPGP